MAVTIPYSFTLFLEKITLTGDHLETARTRHEYVTKRLGGAFHIVESFPTGSLVRGTALRTHSDLDLFLVLNYTMHIHGKTPAQLLQSVRDSLEGLSRVVRKNGQAVTLHFSSWPNVDIVPAALIAGSDTAQFKSYDIPDMVNNTWIRTSPQKHDATMRVQPATRRALIRMAKVWNAAHSGYLQSYHIEALALGTPFTDDDWTWTVFQFFDHSKKTCAWGMWDGLWVGSYLSAMDRIEVEKRLDNAVDVSRRAWYAHKHQSDDKEAIRCYRILFGDTFPAYG